MHCGCLVQSTLSRVISEHSPERLFDTDRGTRCVGFVGRHSNIATAHYLLRRILFHCHEDTVGV